MHLNRISRVRFWLALLPGAAIAQKPVISPDGVVSAASYSTSVDYLGGQYLSEGSIASIFGTNLGASTERAISVPLPTSLGGTTVTVNGVAAPLFFVSPRQVNFQVPSSGISTSSGLVVTTPAGASDPYQLAVEANPSVGIFTLDASGCGPADLLNVAPDGTLSLNSPSTSVSPGQYLSAYGTGLGLAYNMPPDGSPAPSGPLATAATGVSGAYDFALANTGPYSWWDGRAPGLIGVDQFNLQVPATVREGCAVPFQVVDDDASQPVTIAIRNGGGPCVEPLEAGYGEITWERSLTTNSSNLVTEANTVTVSLQESPGKQAPSPPVFMDSNITLASLPGSRVFFGPSCPIPGYRSLDAGPVTVQGPGFGPVAANTAPLQQGQVSGLTVYRATLPAGTIQAGKFTAAATGGSDVGAFQSSVQIGAGIQIATNLAAITLPCNQPVTIDWTGGDPNAWVTVSKVTHFGTYDGYASWQARVSDGEIILPALVQNPPFGPPASCAAPVVPIDMIDLIIEVDPDPSEITPFSVPGLSLGGRHLWKYTYRFTVFAQEP